MFWPFKRKKELFAVGRLYDPVDSFPLAETGTNKFEIFSPGDVFLLVDINKLTPDNKRVELIFLHLDRIKTYCISIPSQNLDTLAERFCELSNEQK